MTRSPALALLVLLLPTLALAQLARPRTAPSTYYVSPQGNNANTCATARAPGASAKRTLNGTQGGIACLTPGDTLMLQDGVWNEQLSDIVDAEHPGTTRPPNGLSWSQPTVIKAEHPRQATLNKPHGGAPYGHVVMFGYSTTQYVSVEGLVIDGRGHNTCVWIGPSSHIRLQGNVIQHCGSNGIFGTTADDGSGGTDIQLLDNEIFNVSVEAPQPPGTHGVYFTGNNSVARGNYIHACPHYGMQFSSELGGVHHNTIENNRIVGCDMAGIISQGSDTVITNNLLEHNCIGIYLSHAATQVLHNTIYGYHRGPHCPDSYGIFDKSYGSTMTNNLVLQQALGWAYIYAMQTPPTAQTNLCDQAGSPACQRIAPAEAVVVDGPGGNLTLVAGGPAVNTGTTLAQVPTDRLGVARPQGAASDIGAYESSTTPPPDHTPPQVAITAPSQGALISGASVAFTATASDNVGVVGLQWQVNGEPRREEQTVPPYAATIDSTAIANGTYTLTAVARDQAGNRTTSAHVQVTVYNGPTQPGPAPPCLTYLGTIGSVPGTVELVCVPEGARR